MNYKTILAFVSNCFSGLKPIESATAILNFSGLAFQKHQVCKPKLETPQLMMPYFALMFRP